MSRHVHGFGETDPKSLVAAGYDQVATSYAGLEGAAGCPRLRWLREVLNSLPDGAVVLDLGCGSGDPAGTEIVKRYRLTGVDVSPAHIELARENAPDGDFVCASAIDVELPPESFDAVVSFYTIDHIPRVEHEELFRKLNTWLRPRGVLLLSVEDCDQPDAVGQWLGVEMFFSHYDAATTERLVQHAGFSIERTGIETQIEAGTEVPYLWLLARKS